MNSIEMQLKVTAETKQAEAAMKKLRAEGEKPHVMKAEYAPTSMSKTARSIGAGGGTGSAASDFAEQSQGLGGLVRVYATFAANIFAASAAFTALSKAADTTNMVKGLDQLGAASGRSLGTLSKQLVKATDGAISLREAMTATAQASAGGMSDSAILRMGAAADKASKALGVAMPDALSRISRGITKLEPELLDEIGIMVRVDRTSQDYAKSIGKTANALTDFEKRQAFANAVLDQAEQKFGAIKIDSNPYAKILSSMSNLAQTGLELVNNVLGPLLKLLSTSPTALATVMAGIAGILLKQAIPAIGAFRENAKRASLETLERVKAQYAEQQKAAIDNDGRLQAIEKANYLRSDVAAQKLAALPKKYSEKALGSDVRGLLKKNPLELTDEEVQRIDKKYLELAEKTDDTSKRQIRELNKRNKILGELEKEAGAFAAKRTDEQIAADERFFTHQSGKQRILESMQKKAAKQQILASASDNAAVYGPALAFQQLKLETAALDASPVEKFATKTKGAFLIAASAVGTFVSSIMGWLAIAGAVVAGITFLVGWISTAKEASAKFTSTMEGIDSAAKTASETLKGLSLKSFEQSFSVSSLEARGNAILGISDSLKGATTAFSDLQKEYNIIERGWDKLSTLWGNADYQVLSRNIAKAVKSAYAIMDDPKETTQLQEAINKAFGKPVSISNLEEALKGLSKEARESVVGKLAPEIEKISNKANIAASAIKSLESNLKNIATSITGNVVSLLPTDQSSQQAINLLKVYDDLKKATSSAERDINGTIQALISNPEFGAYSEELQKQLKLLVRAQDETKNLFNIRETAAKNLASIEERRGKTLAQQKKDAEVVSDQLAKMGTSDSPVVGYEKKMIDERVTAAKELSKAQEDLSKKVNANAKDLASTMGLVLDEANRKLQTSLRNIKDQGILALDRAKLNIRASYGAMVAGEDRSLINKDYDLKVKEVEQSFNLYDASRDNTSAIESLTDELRLRRLSEEKPSDKRTQAEISLEKTNLEASIKAKQLDVEVNKGKREDATRTARSIAIQKINNERNVSLAQNTDQGLKERFKFSQDALSIDLRNIDLKKQLLDLQGKYTNKYSEALSIQEEAISLESISKKYQIDREALEEKIRRLGPKDVAIKQQLESQKKSLDTSETQDKLALSVNSAYERSLKLSEQRLKKDRELLDIEQAKSAIANSQDMFNKAQLAYSKEIGTLSEAEYLTKAASIEQAKASRDLAVSEAQIRLEASDKLKTIEATKAAQEKLPGGLSSEAQEVYTTEKKRVEELRDLKISAASIDFALNAQINAQTLARNVLLSNQNDKLKEAQEITQSLSGVFGELGENVGKLGEAILKLANDDETYLNNKIKLEQELLAAKMAGKDEKDIEKQRAALEKKRAKDELSNIATIASATKKLFGEKTVAYKAFDALEKGMHIAKMAMMATQMVAAWTLSGTEVAASAVAASAKGTKATVAAAADTPGPVWMKLAAGAAMAIFVASLLGNSKGGGVSGPSIQQMQETQGTGQSYDANGNLYNNGGGALGDPTAKSTAIVDGLELLAKINYEMLDFGKNDTLDALKAIKNNTEMFVKVSGAQLAASGGASAFGTQEGTKTSGYQGLGGIFGSSENTIIRNVGTIVSGSIQQLVSGAGLRQTFEDVTVEWSKGFWDKGTNNYRAVKEIEGSVTDYVTGIFKGFRDTLVSVADSMGTTKAAVSQILDSFSISINVSGKGLTGKEYAEAIMSAIGIEMDKAAKQAFPALQALSDQFQEFGETNTDFILRLFDTTKNIKLAFDSIGKSTLGLNPENILSLSKAVGGIDNFISLVDKFGDNFLTEAERLAPIRAAVSTEFTRMAGSIASLGTNSGVTSEQMQTLSLGIGMSRDQFKNLVLGLDTATIGGATLFTALMQVQEGFNRVTESASGATTSAEDLVKSIANIGRSVANSLDAIIEKYRSLFNTVTNSKNAVLDNYLNLKKTEASAQKSLISLVRSSVKSMQDFSFSIRDFIRSLAPMDANTSYAELSSQLEELAPRAKAGDAEAQKNLLSVAKALLSVSESQSTDSTAYRRDVARVSSLLAGVADAVDSNAQILIKENVNAENLRTVKDNQLVKLSESDIEILKDPLRSKEISVSIVEALDPIVEANNALRDAEDKTLAALEAVKIVTNSTSLEDALDLIEVYNLNISDNTTKVLNAFTLATESLERAVESMEAAGISTPSGNLAVNIDTSINSLINSYRSLLAQQEYLQDKLTNFSGSIVITTEVADRLATELFGSADAVPGFSAALINSGLTLRTFGGLLAQASDSKSTLELLSTTPTGLSLLNLLLGNSATSGSLINVISGSELSTTSLLSILNSSGSSPLINKLIETLPNSTIAELLASSSPIVTQRFKDMVTDDKMLAVLAAAAPDTLRDLATKLGSGTMASILLQATPATFTELTAKLGAEGLGNILIESTPAAFTALTTKLGAEGLGRVLIDAPLDTFENLITKLGTEGLGRILIDSPSTTFTALTNKLGVEGLGRILIDAPTTTFTALTAKLGAEGLGNILIGVIPRTFEELVTKLGTEGLGRILIDSPSTTFTALITKLGVEGLGRILIDAPTTTFTALTAKLGAEGLGSILIGTTSDEFNNLINRLGVAGLGRLLLDASPEEFSSLVNGLGVSGLGRLLLDSTPATFTELTAKLGAEGLGNILIESTPAAFTALTTKLGVEGLGKLLIDSPTTTFETLANRLGVAGLGKLLLDASPRTLEALTAKLGAEGLGKLLIDATPTSFENLVTKLGTQGLGKLLVDAPVGDFLSIISRMSTGTMAEILARVPTDAQNLLATRLTTVTFTGTVADVLSGSGSSIAGLIAAATNRLNEIAASPLPIIQGGGGGSALDDAQGDDNNDDANVVSIFDPSNMLVTSTQPDLETSITNASIDIATGSLRAMYDVTDSLRKPGGARWFSLASLNTLLSSRRGDENVDMYQKAASWGVPAFARGGLAYGTALVGEEGPELVDFKTPGRVYTAANSDRMLNNTTNSDLVRELIAQVADLNREVKQLRADQLNGNLGNIQATKQVVRILRDVTEDGRALVTTSMTG